MKFGKKPAVHDPRALLLADYLKPKLPRISAEKNWVRKVKHWHVMENDKLAACTIAAAGHLILEWTTRAGKAVLLHNDAILKAYRDVSGHVPGKPETDNGAAELDVLSIGRGEGSPGIESSTQEGKVLSGVRFDPRASSKIDPLCV